MMTRQFVAFTALAAGISFTGRAQDLRAENRDGKSGVVAQSMATPITPETRGDIFMARKMYREAIETYATIPPNSVTLNKMGIANHQMSNLDAAKKYYEKAIRANPSYAEAQNNLGTIYYAKKSYRRAIKCYKKALELAPLSASIYSNLGTAQLARRKNKEAFEAYETALRLDPDVFERRSTQGVLLMERSVEERAKFHFYLAKTYAKGGQFERALQCMRKAIEEGFKDRSKFVEDHDFAELRKLPEFDALMKLEPRAL